MKFILYLYFSFLAFSSFLASFFGGHLGPDGPDNDPPERLCTALFQHGAVDDHVYVQHPFLLPAVPKRF